MLKDGTAVHRCVYTSSKQLAGKHVCQPGHTLRLPERRSGSGHVPTHPPLINSLLVVVLLVLVLVRFRVFGHVRSSAFSFKLSSFFVLPPSQASALHTSKSLFAPPLTFFLNSHLAETSASTWPSVPIGGESGSCDNVRLFSPLAGRFFSSRACVGLWPGTHPLEFARRGIRGCLAGRTRLFSPFYIDNIHGFARFVGCGRPSILFGVGITECLACSGR